MVKKSTDLERERVDGFVLRYYSMQVPNAWEPEVTETTWRLRAKKPLSLLGEAQARLWSNHL